MIQDSEGTKFDHVTDRIWYKNGIIIGSTKDTPNFDTIRYGVEYEYG